MIDTQFSRVIRVWWYQTFRQLYEMCSKSKSRINIPQTMWFPHAWSLTGKFTRW